MRIRNSASGSVKLMDPKERNATREREVVSTVAWDVTSQPTAIHYHSATLVLTLAGIEAPSSLLIRHQRLPAIESREANQSCKGGKRRGDGGNFPNKEGKGKSSIT